MVTIKDLLRLLGIDLRKKIRGSESALVNEVAELTEIDYNIMEAEAKGDIDMAYQLCMKAANKYRKYNREHSRVYREKAIWLLEECARGIREVSRHRKRT